MSFKTYRQLLRGIARRLWLGEEDIFDFTDAMFGLIGREMELAWREGERACGIKPSERTQEERLAFSQVIQNQRDFVFEFGEWIEENSQANDGALDSVFNRVDIWANRYNETVNQAKTMACTNKKLKWILGDAEHCSTCLKLSGRVHRASVWARKDIYPRDTRPGKLACRGFRCKCSLVPTDQPATRGRFPNLP